MRLNANELSILVRCSISTATKLIRIMNAELENKGYLTIRGSVPKKYAFQRLCIDESNTIEGVKNETSENVVF